MTATPRHRMRVPLIDHHCHGLVKRRPRQMTVRAARDRVGLGPAFGPDDLRLAVRRDRPRRMRTVAGTRTSLQRHRILERPREPGARGVSRLLMPGTGIGTFIVDTGFRSTSILGPYGDCRPRTRDRLPTRSCAWRAPPSRSRRGPSAATFADDFQAELTLRQATAIGFKSIMAYRFGLDFDATAPVAETVREPPRSGSQRPTRTSRLDHPVLLRYVLWTAVAFGKPIQFHVGYGDSDINLHRCDPTQMTEFIRRTVGSGAQILLLHCYPFVREAGFLAQVYPHVWLDTGAALNYTGPSSTTLIRHALEMAPFGKVLFSSDAFGLPELYYCGTLLWRRGLATVLDEWVARDEISARDAVRYVDMMGRGNALRAYGLERGVSADEGIVARATAALLAELPAAAELRHELHASPELSGAESSTVARVVAAIGEGQSSGRRRRATGPHRRERAGRRAARRARCPARPRTDRSAMGVAERGGARLRARRAHVGAGRRRARAAHRRARRCRWSPCCSRARRPCRRVRRTLSPRSAGGVRGSPRWSASTSSPASRPAASPASPES